MSKNVFTKLLNLVTFAKEHEGAVKDVKVYFKKSKRKKLLKNANRDIKVFYSEIEYNETLDKLAADMINLEKNFKMSAAEQVIRKSSSSKVDDTEAKNSIGQLNIWDIEREVKCQLALQTHYPEEVFKDSVELEKFKILSQKVSNQLNRTYNAVKSKNLTEAFISKMNEVKAEVESYDALLQLLK